MVACRKHLWIFVAESTQSYNEWCPKCGAWKRTSQEEGCVVTLPDKVHK